MKKLLAILLTLILTFSCFSLLGTGVAVAETQEMGVNLIESDFHKPTYNNSASSADKQNMSMWQYTSSVEYKDDDGDGTNDYARLTGSAAKTRLCSSTAIVNPGSTYQISFKIRVPEDNNVVTEDFAAFVSGGTTYKVFPVFALYQPTDTEAGKRVSNVYAAGSNDYAYSYVADNTTTRRTDFKSTWTIGDYTFNRDGYSDTGEATKSQYYSHCKDADGNVISPNTLLKEWTTVTMTFTAIEDDENQGPQVVAFEASLFSGATGLAFDFKDFSLVCTDNGTVTKTIMQSDFNDADGTNWRYTNNDVTYCDDNGDGVNDYASVKVNANKQNAGLFSTPFNLVPGNEYELTYYIRVPEGSESFKLGSIFYAPTTVFYQPKVNDAGTKVENVPAVSTVEAENNFYAYKYANTDDPTQNWSRRSSFSATWTIDGYAAKNKTNFSNFDYRDYGSVLSATNTDLNAAFANWTKVTVNFTAMAAVEGETSQVTALGFYFDSLKSSDKNYVFDIKDVALTETASKIQPEPDTTNAIFYEGFEDITQADLESLITNRSSWAKLGLETGDAATGKKAASVYAMWNDLFIPIDKSLIDTSTYYEFSMDWKLKVPTEAKRSSLTKLAIVGYNPSQGETITDNAMSLSYKESLYGTGDWENTTLRFKISDLDSYEQFGILINYSGDEPYDSTDTLYLDTLMIAVAEDQSEVTIIDLDEQERTDDTIKVLAFGNSFSDDATVYIDDIAKADGKDLRVANCAKGGCSLAQHYNYMLNSEAAYSFVYYTKDAERQIFHDVTMQQALAATDWDYIVIQQVSQYSGMSQTFEPYLAELLAYFEEQCPETEILFHTTWAYAANSDHGGFANYGNDQSTMHEAIEDAYLEASARYGYAPLIPTGEAIRIARATSMGDNFNRDGYHLNDKGRMIAALTWYETFTGISALDTKVDLTTLTGTVGETGGITGFVTADESAIIKAAAHEAAARFKLANETQLAIEAIGEVTADSSEAIENAKALRAELNDDGLLPNLQTLIDAIEAFESLGSETILPGDFTGSGTVDLEDVTVLAKLFAGWNVETVSTSLDLNGDGVENLKDLVLLAQYVAGWDVTLS